MQQLVSCPRNLFLPLAQRTRCALSHCERPAAAARSCHRPLHRPFAVPCRRHPLIIAVIYRATMAAAMPSRTCLPEMSPGACSPLLTVYWRTGMVSQGLTQHGVAK